MTGSATEDEGDLIVCGSPESTHKYSQRRGRVLRSVLGSCAGALLLAIAPIAIAACVFNGVELVDMQSRYQRFPLLPDVSFTLSEPGEYAVYHEPATYDDDNPIWLLGLARKLTGPGGVEVPLLSPATRTVSCWNDNCSIQVSVFHATTPGPYRLETSPEKVAEASPSDELAIGRDQTESLWWCIGGGFIALASITVGIFLLVRRRRILY
jgi:hypothetical protein